MIHLIPLQIPAGWAVLYNSFFQEEPQIEEGKIKNISAYKEDVLSIEKVTFKEGRYIIDISGYCIDLGWYPDSDPDGQYRLVVLKGDWDNRIEEHCSRSQLEIAEKINHFLDKYQYD